MAAPMGTSAVPAVPAAHATRHVTVNAVLADLPGAAMSSDGGCAATLSGSRTVSAVGTLSAATRGTSCNTLWGALFPIKVYAWSTCASVSVPVANVVALSAGVHELADSITGGSESHTAFYLPAAVTR